jgi:hypothetical protein
MKKNRKDATKSKVNALLRGLRNARLKIKALVNPVNQLDSTHQKIVLT